MALWRAFEAEAPEIAARARERFEQAGVALLGTLRRDGSPRISPVEPHVVHGHLLFAAMARTEKDRDLARDPRCVLHSLVTDSEGADPEAKLYGRAQPLLDRELRDAPASAWWVGRPEDAARVFTFDVTEAALVSWDPAGGEMLVRSWAGDRGVRERRRAYP